MMMMMMMMCWGNAIGQVSVMLRVCPTDGGGHGSSALNVDTRSRQQVVLHNPTAGGATASSAIGHVTAAQRQISPPKMFAFDAVFSPNDCLVRALSFLMDRIDYTRCIDAGYYYRCRM